MVMHEDRFRIHDLDQLHHAAIFVGQDMAVQHKRAGEIRVPLPNDDPSRIRRESFRVENQLSGRVDFRRRQLARQQPPGCVILDLSNPGLNVAEFVAALKTLDPPPTNFT